MERTIHDTARLAGVTPRALRHYDAIGLLRPSGRGPGGARCYDEAALVRLQRILLLRDLGLRLPQIAEVLARDDGAPDEGSRARAQADALSAHLSLLRQEQDRLARQIAAVERTLDALTGQEELMADTMFDGFDHAQYRDEVEDRWGRDARVRSDRWWSAMPPQEREAWTREVADLNAAWRAAAADPALAPGSRHAQDLARRHVEWLRSIPGTPAADPDGDLTGYVRGLGAMYVADPRFAANYGGPSGAEFVRDALAAWADEAVDARGEERDR